MNELRTKAAQLGYAINYSGMYANKAVIYPVSAETIKKYGPASYEIDMADIPAGLMAIETKLNQIGA